MQRALRWSSQHAAQAHAARYPISSKREEHKSSGIPQGVGEDKGRQALGQQTIEQPPAEATGSGCKQQHEVAAPHMHQRVTEGGNCKTAPGTPSFCHTTLYETAPEEFLGRSDNEEQEQSNSPAGETAAHIIDGIHLRAGKGEEELAHLVTQPEEAPQANCQSNAQHHSR